MKSREMKTVTKEIPEALGRIKIVDVDQKHSILITNKKYVYKGNIQLQVNPKVLDKVIDSIYERSDEILDCKKCPPEEVRRKIRR